MPEHEQGDAVVGRVAQEVERIGQQRDRLRGEAGADLDREHGEIDRERDPQDAAIDGRSRPVIVTVTAAMCTHLKLASAHMGDHVLDHAPHVGIVGAVVDLLALPVRPHQACAFQQTQVVAYQ